jgi:hypothetical protein
MSGRVIDFSSARKNRLTGYIEILFLDISAMKLQPHKKGIAAL